MLGRVITAGLVVASLSLPGLGGRRAGAQDGYSSPFSITLDPAITGWTSDFSARQAAIDANTTPPMTVWYSSTTSYAGYPYGPLNPQLYSSGSLASPGDATALQFDRGHPVLNVTMNAIPGGVDTTTWQRQRVMAAANVLLQAGTHYQHLHLPTFDPAQVTSGTGFPWIPVSTNATLQSSWHLAHGVSGTTPNPYAAAYGQPKPGIDAPTSRPTCTAHARCSDALGHADADRVWRGVEIHARRHGDGNVAGHLPPPGVHILPFADSNWFYQDFQVVMRVIPLPEPGGFVLAVPGLVLVLARRVQG